MASFEIKNLTFTYPGEENAPALEDISLTVEKGEYLVLCGSSGSGKTTLLRHLKSALMPHGKRVGEILFDGASLDKVDMGMQAAQIGYVMQDPDSQIVTDKVWHEIAFGLENLGVDQKVMRLRVVEMASYFGIQNWFYKDVNELSGGQKQLLNLASVMAMQPKVLILDEPTSSLDPIAASDFLNTVKKINLELGTTVIITEHRLEDVLHAADRVAILEHGKLTAVKSPKNIGAFLRKAQSPMYESMPVPVRVYYGVDNDLDCPLTVREGRNWLEIMMKNKGKIKIHDACILDADSKYEDRSREREKIAVSIKKIRFRYGKKQEDVLKDTSIAIKKGEIFAIVGGNGTGKTTLLKAVCGVLKPYSGKIKIEGKKTVMLPQDPKSLFVKESVEEELYEMTKDMEKINDTVRMCGIEHILKRHPHDLSGGEQHKTAFAKVLLTNPEILLLDEPTGGMDNFFKKNFEEMLKELKRRKVTIIMVTHDIEFCAGVADRVGMFFDGDIVTVNTSRKFFAGNSFYTTAASRMSRDIFDNAVRDKDVIELCRKNM